ncbi:TOMM precursor leader peptide-binding protein [Streptomyces sp. RB6PN25]|uniref:TOMM leader peptide-binding protein n=1 Tax=Streptomyces humicola TaxID=2953240 RepID=A0ABT1Q2V5_9ACTN|nr:TOMM precursor leader peptide-binding protein [Streptomyces humicola]MCQ4084273.1 TOMM precursor leader peptide-binding protein [Streptomyces humicola]
MPGFKAHLRAEVVPGEGTYLFSERGVKVIENPQLELLAPLMDSRPNLGELLRAAPRSIAPQEIGYLLGKLAEAELVDHLDDDGGIPLPDSADSTTPPDHSARAFWELGGLDGAHACSRSRSGSLRLLTVGGADGSAVLSALRTAGLSVLAQPGTERNACLETTPGLSVIICSDYLDEALAEVDATHRASRRPWLLAKPHGADIWVGPVFEPENDCSPCWHCLAHRLRDHREVEGHVQRALGRRGPLPVPTACIPASVGLGAQLIALEATKWLAGHRYGGQGSVLVADSHAMRSRHHEVLRRPQCPHCGDPSLVADRLRRPVRLVSRPKAHTGGGGDRAMRPAEVLARYRHLVSPVSGVVRALEADPQAPPGLNVFRAGHNLALGSDTLRGLKSGLRGQSSGKGLTPLDAEVGALCEALERYSAVFTGTEALVHDSLRGLGDIAVHPNRCQLYHERQYADRDRWNGSHSAFHYVCEPFDEKAPLDWTPVWSLTEQRQRLLPTGYLYYNAPHPDGHCFVRADSNGCAAGSSLEDAIVQGFLELVERDSVALWWYNRTHQPAVSLEAFDEPWIAERRVRYADLHREIWALDLTADLGIPTVAALSRRTDKPAEDIVIGLGAHFDVRTAMRRALTELDQMLPFVAMAAPDGTGYDCSSPEVLDWCRRATTGNQPYLLANPAEPARVPDDFPTHRPSPDLLGDIQEIERVVTGKGMELLVIDQTRPDIGLPVARVIVPGLRHFWARFASGRLYDVPLQLGRRDTPIAYEELNPIPVFF